MGCAVAGATLKVPAVAVRIRYLKVYSPCGNCSKKKFVPESLISSYQQIPKSHLCLEMLVAGSNPAPRGSRRWSATPARRGWCWVSARLS